MHHRAAEYCHTLLPGDSVDEVMESIRAALAQGRAVTVAFHDATISTQEAADVLGISRPTLIRLLERGEIPYEQPGSHRRLRLEDVLVFQQRHRQQADEGAVQE